MAYANNKEMDMARPMKERRICSLPAVRRFSPENGNEGEDVVMGVDELEVIRLIDYEMMDQEQAASLMQVARATIQMMYTEARRKCATALVEGRPLSIRGGQVRLCGKSEACPHRICQRKKDGCGLTVAFPLGEGKTISDLFARSSSFAFLDGNGNLSYKANPVKAEESAAAVKAVRFLLGEGVAALVVPRLGQHALSLLKNAKVELFRSRGESLEENVRAFREGKLAHYET